MILGSSLGASWLGAYHTTGTAAAEEPEPPVASATPSGGTATYPVTRADTDLTGLYRKIQYGVDAPRFPGSRQEFVDGEWRNLDAGLEEVGAPKREKPTFEPPVPWTPDSDREEPEPVIEPKEGQEGIGLTLPRPPTEDPTPARKRRPLTPRVDADDDAMVALLVLLGGMW